ncbi:type II toxin-antitoxin system VapC family toxin [Protofrankia symbiont of Coriaria ruscifolia]|uniref:type II toxin-antitoxin system VapC family toxin n=1 Tax=Protofrankia symbiont of Coriaria ruscifolia TaxID=1306542 RepID=UPI001041ACD9|nr:type II toxin-antitoxin system VapC family toxin [Protofrankia symbiont of Coriaria ruscifolia]
MSRYLLDTQVWLWLLAEPRRLRDDTRDLLTDTANEVLLSAASGWEISIKYRLGKLVLPEPPRSYVPDRMRRTGMTPLAVEHDHVLRVAELPDHHRDPFDRLLVAQAQALDVPLVTADGQLSAYEVKTLPA